MQKKGKKNTNPLVGRMVKTLQTTTSELGKKLTSLYGNVLNAHRCSIEPMDDDEHCLTIGTVKAKVVAFASCLQTTSSCSSRFFSFFSTQRRFGKFVRNLYYYQFCVGCIFSVSTILLPFLRTNKKKRVFEVAWWVDSLKHRICLVSQKWWECQQIIGILSQPRRSDAVDRCQAENLDRSLLGRFANPQTICV